MGVRAAFGSMCYVPGIVGRGFECEPNLAHDLHPELRGGAGFTPRRLGDGGPDVIGVAGGAIWLLPHIW